MDSAISVLKSPVGKDVFDVGFHGLSPIVQGGLRVTTVKRFHEPHRFNYCNI
jgi:hypothetical protein